MEKEEAHIESRAGYHATEEILTKWVRYYKVFKASRNRPCQSQPTPPLAVFPPKLFGCERWPKLLLLPLHLQSLPLTRKVTLVLLRLLAGTRAEKLQQGRRASVQAQIYVAVSLSYILPRTQLVQEVPK
jgi:hypothetical protein